MIELNGLSDDFYVNMVLQTEMDLPQQRDTLLHYFEQMRKRFSNKSRFFARDKGEFVLEEDREGGIYRWTSVEAKRLQSGVVNPESIDAAVQQHLQVLEIAPYALTLSHLDCESLSVIFGFDYQFSGNQSELIADVLGVPLSLSSLIDHISPGMVSYEPAIQFAIDGDMHTQARLSFETRGNPFQAKEPEFNDASDEILSVYLTLRHFEGTDNENGFSQQFNHLIACGSDLLQNHIIESVLRPLQSAIAAR